MEDYNKVIEYSPPEWCKSLKIIPKYRIPLAMTPTPIHEWKIEDVPDGFELYVKRDDLTGCTLSGNKIRKLEFLLADAKIQGCGSVITSGATQSNHARCTMVAARQVGLDCHLILRDKKENCKTSQPSGNFLLMESCEANIYLLPWDSFDDEVLEEKRNILADHIQKTNGKKAYRIEEGGDNNLGIYGYLRAWEEMLQQDVDKQFDDVVVATGTSGTACGLAIGNYLTGSKLKVHGIMIARTKEEVHGSINAKLKKFGLNESTCAQDIVDVIDGHIGGGYCDFTKDDVAYHQKIFKSTGVYCDQTYVGKAVRGLIEELKKNPGRFKGNRILFIHTGGIFGMFDSSISQYIRNENSLERIKRWNEVFPDNS